ncbi:cell division cycle protein-like protein [Delitschia confertaspora ATCC 74209]|uniref:Cell division cycle protein-like protein n=1 Tax=Delitschia confertaspora ATCC 74209 TaxID=1513339 RepID=A0A9P4JHD1_9PLEO|nr:cell division cycle protein-like protein [Delitschia confertaspora ATCC 74209]
MEEPSATLPQGSQDALTELPFPPLTKSHILNCSYHSWHPRYRSITPKARLIPLSDAFISYLRGDGIVLPPENTDNPVWSDSDSGIFSGADNASEAEEEEEEDPSLLWRDIHESIQQMIQELGGKVVPKLNWSAPKDATWIAATNSMECRTPNDIYLLLKSSDFVTHDLEHAFDDCVEETTSKDSPEIPYHLVLRKQITLNPSVEFRCFVRRRKLIALCQRDLNYFEFLFKMQDQLRDTIQDFFDTRIRDTFPDESFTFDVYVPPPHKRVWLIDFNPWAQRTDPLLFSWLELLTLSDDPRDQPSEARSGVSELAPGDDLNEDQPAESETESLEFIPEFRLVRRDDPEAYGFTTPQYSAHKLPRDVVDASRAGGGNLREFATQWKEALAKQQQADEEDSSEE